MKIARGGWSHIAVVIVVPGLLAAGAAYLGWVPVAIVLALLSAVLVAFMVYFFRDPDRPVIQDSSAVLSGADGWVRCVERIDVSPHLGCAAIRISTFLTPFDVHVNRSPIAGTVKSLGYTPGRHLLTIREASAEENEHSTIVIHGPRTSCVVRQIVGPIVRRVVYWLTEGQTLGAGERLGIMKFGSRLDVILPADQVDPLVRKGDRVFAGITAIARIRKGGGV